MRTHQERKLSARNTSVNLTAVYGFLVFRHIGEYISLDLFYFVNLCVFKLFAQFDNYYWFALSNNAVTLKK